MTDQRTTTDPIGVENPERRAESHNSDADLSAAATEKTPRAWWPLGQRRRRSPADAAIASTPADDDIDGEATAKSTGIDEADPESTRDDPAQVDAASPTHTTASTRRQTLLRVISYGVVPALVVVLASGTGYLKYIDSTARAAERASGESQQAAKDTTVAMLSYTPDTADITLIAAGDRLTGAFRDSYASLVRDVVIPGAKQKKVSAAATVPATASISATADHAVVLVYVNQAITMGDGAPTQTNSVVQVTLERSGDHWLVSGFDPK